MDPIQTAATNAKHADDVNIKSISFTPNQKQIDDLIDQSNKAEEHRKLAENFQLEDYSLLSKFPKIYALCPKTMNPNDTILVSLGRKSDISDQNFSIIANTTMPYGGTSNGSNGVLIDCQIKYGENRLNLFYANRQCTKNLLQDYITMRDKNIDSIFNLLIQMMKTHQNAGYPIKSTDLNGTKLDSKYHKIYDNVIEMFEIIQNNNGPNQCGLGIISYCQTWLRGENGTVGSTNCSVMSPHFQNRFYIKDISTLIKINGINQLHLESYTSLIQHFNNIMSPEYGGINGQAFINLDALHTIL